MSTALAGDNRPPGSSEAPRSKAGPIVLLILGSLASILGLVVLAAGIALAAASAMQSEDGYTAPPAEFTVSSYAITSPGIDIAGDTPIPPGLPFDVATVRLQATSADPGDDVFIGIAPRADVEQYLTDVNHTEVRDVRYRPFSVEYREVRGTETPEPPDDQDFWTEAASGPGAQEIEWLPQPGDWSIVVMNTDASRGVDVEFVAGVRTDLLWPVAIGLIVGGGLTFLIGLALLIPGAVGLGRRAGTPPAIPPVSGPGGAAAAPAGVMGATAERTNASAVAGGPPGTGVPPAERGDPLPFEVRQYPAYLSGRLDPGVSRGLWLVKWLLAIPHYLILALLWFAFLVTTIVAGFAILFTGRYPSALFQFNVGVLRWNWRVSFYAYSALGTDQYPPFTLSRTEYPADFDVEYPDRLSNGLVLVKWWLLALPHLLIVGVLAGTSWVLSSQWLWSWLWAPSWGNWPGQWGTWPGEWGDDVWTADAWTGGVSLLGLLVIVAAIILLFAGRYPKSLFDLVMGVNRWAYRVLTYVALLRDEYPPFRLDQGPHEVARELKP